MTFKVGDRVKVKDGHYIGYTPGSNYNVPREHGIVSDCGKGYVYIKYGDKITPPLNPESFELVETHFPLYSEETAVKLLEERDYTVTPPPEPLKGKIVVYISADKTIWGVSEVTYNDWNAYVKKGHIVLAIVDWVEGEGL